jgi:uncharacterized protein (DUF3084 family)
MLQKRFGQEFEPDTEERPDGAAAAVETARSITSVPLGAPKEEKKDEEKVSMFWRVFGGTILSIVALVSITLFNNLQGSITDLRNELSREREARSGLAKKDEMDTRMKTQYDRIRGVEGFKTDIETMKERTGANAAAVETVRKELSTSVDMLKKDTAGLEVIKERVASLEGVKKDIAGLDAMKEKITALTADLKTTREELQKAKEEVEKNKASDLERKAFRDSQAKQLDETLKELQKSVQACREKIARLEGATTPEKKKPMDNP